MSDNDSNRRYSDEEVRLLLKRAAELESQRGSLPARTEGPTLAELESIAGEAGINPALLRQAARELDQGTGELQAPSPGASSRLLGAPLALELERVVSGEASPGGLESLLPIVQRAADGKGQPALLGRTFTWQSSDFQSTRQLQVTVTVTRGETRILVEERYGNLAGALFGGIGGGVGGGVGLGVGIGVGVGALGSALFATLFPLTVIAGSLALARTLFQQDVRRRQRVLQRLMDELVRAVEDDVGAERPRLKNGS